MNKTKCICCGESRFLGNAYNLCENCSFIYNKRDIYRMNTLQSKEGLKVNALCAYIQHRLYEDNDYIHGYPNLSIEQFKIERDKIINYFKKIEERENQKSREKAMIESKKMTELFR
jgi:hypothetical protein